MNREQMLGPAKSGSAWDLAVIGGGATGLGIAVDAATRGYRTILLEAGDFAKGASGRSSKIAHGWVGHFEFAGMTGGLELMRERGLLHRNAPHIVRHQSFIVPRYQWWEGPVWGLGFKIYDALAGRLSLAPSRSLTRDEAIGRAPALAGASLLGATEYFDAAFDDARLAVVMARTAAHHGACVLNHARVTALKKTGGLVSGLEFEDAETGERHEIGAAVVVNAAGNSSHEVAALDEPPARPAAFERVAHILVAGNFLAGGSGVLLPGEGPGQVTFAVPWLGRVLVGASIARAKDISPEPRPAPADISRLLKSAARVLSEPPREKDILSAFASLRRAGSAGGRPRARAFRPHGLTVSRSGLLCVSGTRWATFRRVAEEAVDHAAVLGGLPERPCMTRELHLHGWRSPNAEELPAGLADYGSDAEAILRLMAEDPDLAAPLHPALPYPKACIVWAARHEMARTLEDALARRTRAVLLDARAASAAAPEAARLLAAELGRDDAWAAAQATEFGILAARHCYP